LYDSPSFAAEPAGAIQQVNYTGPAAPRDEQVDLDLAKSDAQARVVYVSSGPIALSGNMIDHDVRTVFHFAGSDLHPTVILKLAQNDPLHRVGAVFAPETNTTLHIYLLNNLPKNQPNLTGGRSVAYVVDGNKLANAAVDLAPSDAHYVAFQWTRQQSSRAPFAVAELSAFTTISASQIAPTLAKAGAHSSQSKADLSSQVDTLAVPPDPAVVSP
jgi:hypothetical protein